MAASTNSQPFTAIPVIILDNDGALPDVVYLMTQSCDGPSRNGEAVMHELRQHLRDTKLARFRKRCAFECRIVSIAKLISTSHGFQLTAPIYDAQLTGALRKPAVLRNFDATQLINADEVVILEWQVNREARAMAAKFARVAIRIGVVVFGIVNLVGV